MWAPNGSRCQISIDVDPRGGQKSSGGSSEGDVRCQMVISFILKWFAVEGIARSYFAVQQRLQQVAGESEASHYHRRQRLCIAVYSSL